MTRLLPLALVLALAAGAGPPSPPAADLECTDRSAGVRGHACEVRTEVVRPGGDVFEIDAGVNGGITVVGADRADVRVQARVEAWGDDEAGALARLALSDLAGDVRAHTVNGAVSVRLAGRTWRGAGLDARTNNGSVQLALPARYDADLEAGSNTGPVRVDDRGFERSGDGRRVHLRLGDGGPPVRVTTINGAVLVRTRDAT